MEFNINLILVPVTLVLLVAWLADRLWLKQHKHAAIQNRKITLAQGHLEQTKKTFKETLERFGHQESVDEFIGTQHTPDVLNNASIAYQEAKRSLVQAQGVLTDNVPKEFFLVRWAYEYLPILLVIVLVRSFVAQPFNIPSSSMVPTLYTGDFIVVNMSAYGLRLPLTHTKIFSTGSPKHGDVVVFRYPENPKRYYIKRMIGLPGDTIRFDNDALFVNGQKVPMVKTDYQMPATLNAKIMPQRVADQVFSDQERIKYGQEEEKHARYYRETLGEHQYQVRYLGDLNSAQMAPFLLQNSPQTATSGGVQWQITVPQDQYFVMGDNRDRSEDGRFWGFVPEENLAGKATYIWMHKEAGLSLPSFGRAGKID